MSYSGYGDYGGYSRYHSSDRVYHPHYAANSLGMDEAWEILLQHEADSLGSRRSNRQGPRYGRGDRSDGHDGERGRNAYEGEGYDDFPPAEEERGYEKARPPTPPRSRRSNTNRSLIPDNGDRRFTFSRQGSSSGGPSSRQPARPSGGGANRYPQPADWLNERMPLYRPPASQEEMERHREPYQGNYIQRDGFDFMWFPSHQRYLPGPDYWQDRCDRLAAAGWRRH